MNRDEHLQLLKERVGMLKQLNEWANKLGPASRRSRGLFFILERFHLNHRAAFSESALFEIESLENDLLKIGATCALLTISPENVEQRIISRTPDEWAKKTIEEIKKASDELIQTQIEYRNQSKKSVIPTIEINTDDRDWVTYANKIMGILA